MCAWWKTIRYGNSLDKNAIHFEIILVILTKKGFAYGYLRPGFSTHCPLKSPGELLNPTLWKQPGPLARLLDTKSLNMMLEYAYFKKAPPIILMYRGDWESLSESIRKNSETKNVKAYMYHAEIEFMMPYKRSKKGMWVDEGRILINCECHFYFSCSTNTEFLFF